MTLPVCTICSAKEIIAIEPGADPVYAEAVKIPLQHGQPVRAWCQEHWPFLRATASAPPATRT